MYLDKEQTLSQLNVKTTPFLLQLAEFHFHNNPLWFIPRDGGDKVQLPKK